MRIGVSHTFMYKKLDEFGHQHLEEVLQSVKDESERLSSNDCNTEEDHGRKIVFDNIDHRTEVRCMSQENQNTDEHWVSVMVTDNRISGNHLSNKRPPPDAILKMDIGLCLPDGKDHSKQIENYGYLVSRIVASKIKCWQFLNDCTIKHIPHKYSTKTKEATKTQFVGLIYENENEAQGMQKVLQELHQKFVPYSSDAGERQFSQQAIVGDQLSVERGVNTLLQLANGFTQSERLEGIHFEIADFHGGMKFLQYGYDKFYGTKSAADKCTLYNDRLCINRRNVTTDVSRKFEACKRFFLLEIEARVVAAVLQLLEIGSITDEPSNERLPLELLEASSSEKATFLHNLTSKVVDMVVQKSNHAEMMLKKIEYENWLQQNNKMTDDGKYKCRHPSCNKVFQYDGTRRVNHEKMHGLHKSVIIEETPKRDDMFSYQVAFVEYGLLLYNFFDAVAEADGDRLLRCWKFFLLHMRSDGARSRKYALEALYLICQVEAILSPRDAHRLLWNRSHKSKCKLGGNVALDLTMEHYNNLLKSILRHLGPNSTNKSAIDRYCKALTCNKKILDNFDQSANILKRSGKHVEKMTDVDFNTIVKNLLEQNALKFTGRRHYKCFPMMKSSLLEDLDMHAVYQWIKEHKMKICKIDT
eukprot:gene2297-2644_t